eukprot:15445612-Alexandrium_andersonii.AAC.1
MKQKVRREKSTVRSSVIQRKLLRRKLNIISGWKPSRENGLLKRPKRQNNTQKNKNPWGCNSIPWP